MSRFLSLCLMRTFRVSVDVGGTFTDLIALNEDEGSIFKIKVPTTPTDPEQGVEEALQEFLTSSRHAEISSVIHATTIATNALTGQIGLELPKTSLITTKGFKDIIEIGRQRRHQLYNLFVQRPKPLIPRRYRYTIEERIDAEGDIVTPLKQAEVVNVSNEILENNIEAVAIGFLNSYVNPVHEQRVKEIVNRVCPNLLVTTSYEVSPEHREYERFSTTVVNACLMPIVSTYIDNFLKMLRRIGIKSQLQVMQSSGGITSGETVRDLPASVIESGPAAGVIAASFYGKLVGLENVLSFDMGGTTAKAGILKAYMPEVVTEYEVGGNYHVGRIVKGSGYPVRFPFIDLSECSAGGGTIAWVDSGKALRVGPLSAGAEPGPACYGHGGEAPTVTDANLLLGRLNPEHLLGGKIRINRDLSEKAVKSSICDILEIGVVQASSGIIRIVNSNMSKILRIVSIERGYDPREFTLMAFGGAGPMHACALADDLGISSVLIPLNPGLFSTLGMLAADSTHHFVRPIMKGADEIDVIYIKNLCIEMEREGRKVLDNEGSHFNNTHFMFYADLRYHGQAYELIVPISKPIGKNSLSDLIKSFHEKHRLVYGYSVDKGRVEVVNLRLTAVGVTSKPILRKMNSAVKEPIKASSNRQVFFEELDKFIDCPIYLRNQLKAGNIINSPSIIEQYDSTTIIYPSWEATVDGYGNLLMYRCK